MASSGLGEDHSLQGAVTNMAPSASHQNRRGDTEIRPCRGAEGFARELTERLARDPRWEFHVFANRWVPGSDRIRFHKVPILSFPKFLTTPSFAYFADRRIRKAGIDLIHAHDRIFRADLFTMHGVPHRYWIREVRHKGMSLLRPGDRPRGGRAGPRSPPPLFAARLRA